MKATRKTMILAGAVLAAGLIGGTLAAADGAAGYAAFERGDYATAYAEFLPLAESGQASAQAALGQMYLDGLGVPQDMAVAAQWLERAAIGGNARAQAQIGTMYHIGIGVTADPAKAAYYTEAAANQNVARAQVDVAAMYYQGVGVAKDPAKAYLYAALAARQGTDEGVALNAFLAEKITPADRQKGELLLQAWQPTVPSAQ